MANDAVETAIQATDRFARALRDEDQAGWAARFEAIAAYLRQGELAAALHAYRNTSYTGPGSLSDLFVTNEAAFGTARAECHSALCALGRA